MLHGRLVQLISIYNDPKWDINNSDSPEALNIRRNHDNLVKYYKNLWETYKITSTERNIRKSLGYDT